MRSLREIKDEIRALVRAKVKVDSIEEVLSLDFDTFLSYATSSKPIVFRGYSKNWPFTVGGLDAFSLCFDELSTVKVRTGEYSRANSEFEYKNVLASDYIRLIANKPKELDYAGYQVVPAKAIKQLHYPEWLPTYSVDEPMHFWLGPKGTYTAVHSDTCDKLVYQAVGSKSWYIISPIHHGSLKVDPDFGRGYDTSPIDPRKNDLSSDVVHKVTLYPGDMFFLPGAWYHAVVSNDTSLSFEYKSNPVPCSIEDKRIYEKYIKLILEAKALKK